MRKIAIWLAGALAASLLTLPANAFSTSATAAILMDADSGRVLYERAADEKRLIASTTKLMTALVAAERLEDLSQIVTIKGEWLQTEGSSIYLKAGEQITQEGLLYGLLLESGNDAALALAGVCAGGEAEFAELMNEKARTLGMTNSHFTNASGLNADEHYSTARDMAKLAAACLKNETVAKICASRSATIGNRTFTNHNRLLTMYEGCVGMKTGFTKRAGRTLVSAARRNGQTLVAVTLNDPDDWKDHMAMFDYGFAAYPAKQLCRAGELVGSLPVEGSLVRFVDVEAGENFYYPLAEGESVEMRLEYADLAEAPVRKGECAGRMVCTLNGQDVGAIELHYAQTVNRDAFTEGSWLQRILSAIFGRTVTVSHNRGGLV